MERWWKIPKSEPVPKSNDVNLETERTTPTTSETSSATLSGGSSDARSRLDDSRSADTKADFTREELRNTRRRWT